jgi:hypothetical protein
LLAKARILWLLRQSNIVLDLQVDGSPIRQAMRLFSSALGVLDRVSPP